VAAKKTHRERAVMLTVGMWLGDTRQSITRMRKKYSERPRALREVFVLVMIAVVVFAVSAVFDIFNMIISWIYRHETWQLDEIFTVTIYLVLAIAVYAFRRYNELVVQIRLREEAERERERLIPELESARADIQRLRILLPICYSCKKIRGDSGYWEEAETYVEVELNTKIAHGLCPDCAKKDDQKWNLG
jgi:hypothetical protein